MTTKVGQTIGAEQAKTTQQHSEVQNPVKPQAKMIVMAGDNLQDIDKLGSDGQKIVKTLFSNSDWSGDLTEKQTFSELEAANFNKFTISSRPGQINLYHKETGREIEIKYDEKSLKDLQDEKYFLNSIQGNGGQIELAWGNYQKGGKDYISKRVDYIGDYAKLTIDTVNNTLTVIGGDGNVYGHGLEKLTIKDSSMKDVHVDAKTIELKNVKDEGFLWDSATEVVTYRSNKVKYDENSKVKVTYTKD